MKKIDVIPKGWSKKEIEKRWEYIKKDILHPDDKKNKEKGDNKANFLLKNKKQELEVQKS